MKDYSDVSDFDNCESCGKIECECYHESIYDEQTVEHEDYAKGFKSIFISISVLLGLLIIGNNFLPYSYRNKYSEKIIFSKCRYKKR